MITHWNVLRESGNWVTRDDVLVSWVPPWHDLGLVRFVIGPVYTGAPCHIVQPAVSTIPQWLATITRVRGSITGAPDFAYRLASRMVDPAEVDLSSLRWSINGGEPVRISTIEQFERRFGVSGAIAPGYGLAEATLTVTTHKPGDPHVVDALGNVSCGTPLPGIEVHANGNASTPGEILVRGETVFAGYFDADDETRRCLKDGWLRTGDVGYRDEQGRLYVLGRRRAMIKRGGVVVPPRELEEAAEAVDGVRLVAAVGVPADSAEVTETITVVAEIGRSDSRPAESIAGDVSRAIAATCGFAPGKVVVVPPRAIPRTANGKVRHDHLRTLLLDGLIVSATG